MRAVVVREFGGPEVLVAGDVPTPVPRAGEVLVRVGYANITFVETQVRAGRAPFPAPTPPYIPGNGVGGVIESGRRVITSTGGTGAYAEYVAVPADEPIDVPDGLDLADAVALLADGRTAAALAAAAHPLAGQRVLVLAAAGGVGSLLVQLAKRAGATVVAAAGSDVKLHHARTLGADVTVNYRFPGWTREVDVVFDGVGGDIGRAAFESLRDGGRMFVYGLASGSFSDVRDGERGITVTRRVLPDRELTVGILTDAAAGLIKPVVGQRFPLERAADAHAAMEARTAIGKTLLVVSGAGGATAASTGSTGDASSAHRA